MLRKALATIAAATILVTAFAVAPADAKKGKKGNRDRQETTTVAPSFDRRMTGRTRTCGYDTMQYDSRHAVWPLLPLTAPLAPRRAINSFRLGHSTRAACGRVSGTNRC